MARLDKRGRRIGHNWWRELNCDLLLTAAIMWETECEVMAVGYETEIAEYAEANPRPNLKDFLVRNKGLGKQPS